MGKYNTIYWKQTMNCQENSWLILISIGSCIPLKIKSKAMYSLWTNMFDKGRSKTY